MRRTISTSYTLWIIVANVVVFIIGIALLSYNPRFIDYIALLPANIIQGKAVWTLLTSMFMHAPNTLSHLLVNMISLLFIGSFVEKLIGKKRYLGLYMAGGFFAGLFFVILAGLFGNTELGARIVGSPQTYAVGASGAIFALGGLLAVLTPRLKVLLFFIIPMPMWFAMFGMLFILWFASLAIGLPVGNVAHLGGLLVGVGYGFYLKKKYPHKTAMISRYFSQ